MATKILLIIFWIITILLTMTQWAGPVADQDVPAANKIIAGIIFLIGAPIFCTYTALSGILDYILPEGWDNDDNFKT